MISATFLCFFHYPAKCFLLSPIIYNILPYPTPFVNNLRQFSSHFNISPPHILLFYDLFLTLSPLVLPLSLIISYFITYRMLSVFLFSVKHIKKKINPAIFQHSWPSLLNVLPESFCAWFCEMFFVSRKSKCRKIPSVHFIIFYDDTRVKRSKNRCKLACKRIFDLLTRQKHE